jgi:hypothetical protein
MLLELVLSIAARNEHSNIQYCCRDDQLPNPVREHVKVNENQVPSAYFAPVLPPQRMAGHRCCRPWTSTYKLEAGRKENPS